MSVKQTLLSLADAVQEDEVSDSYGTGELIENVEKEIASLLGKEKALFLPSGTMAQLLALKIWSDQQRTPYVALPATSHLQLHEHNSFQVLYHLKGITLGKPHTVPTLDDIKTASHDPLAAVLLELPMREIGGQLPEWDDLVEQTKWLREQGIKVHMDGARLWQCPAHYHKSLADISALFDSVYVSFYKDLGGIAGACLAGDAQFIERAKIWARRVGGNLYALFPYVIAAREGLKRNLPAIPERRQHAIWLAEQLNAIPFVTTWPLKPQTNMFRIRLQTDNVAEYLARSSAWMETNKIALLPAPYEIGEKHCMMELTIGSSFGLLDQSQWESHIKDFQAFVLPERNA